MKRSTFTLTWLSLALVFTPEALCQPAGRSPELADILNFEATHSGTQPGGWGGGPTGTVFIDNQIVHGGRWSARFERNKQSPNQFSALTIGLPIDFTGRTVTLRGFLRTEEASEFVGLWMREDGESPALAFDNMQKQSLRGTHDWQEYSITLPIDPRASQLYFGVLLAGTGKAWADDLQLLVDGQPIWKAPSTSQPSQTIVDSDHEFDAGSRIDVTQLSDVQIHNLATLGRAWGFLKYHHPDITAGRRQWDYDLFRVLPGVLTAPDQAAANAVLLKWIASLGPVGPCSPCAELDESDLHLRPEVAWIADSALLGSDLSGSLKEIYGRRPRVTKQFYVSLHPGVGNPSFDHESSYKHLGLPDAGFQILALFRFWNIVAYWFPYRDVIGEDWGEVLHDFVPRVALARTPDDYSREMLALIARVHDTHANLWSSLEARPPVGACQLPVNQRFIDKNIPVVTGYAGEAGKLTGLRPGDVFTHLDGISVPKLVESWLPYYAASNQPTQLRDIGRSMTKGPCGKATIKIVRSGESIEMTADRVPESSLNLARTHDLPGETFRLLCPEVGYLKLSSVKMEEAPRYVERAAGTKGLIIDIRNYPSAFVVFALGSLFVEKQTEFVRFTTGDVSTPGAFHWTKALALQPQKPQYTGKVVILLDEVSQSNAEYTAMAFRAGPRARIVGSTTAGADGNVSAIPLPGGLRSMISGIGVFYPDKRPTQRVGIRPDVEVKPTIAGIRAGRDEVLEAAIREILGSEIPAARIEQLTRH